MGAGAVSGVVDERCLETRQFGRAVDDACEARDKRTVASIQNHPRARLDVTKLSSVNLVGRNDKDAAVPVDPRVSIVLRERTLKSPRAFRQISRSLFVDEDEIETDAARSKVTLRGERFVKEWGIRIVHANQHDGVVARDPSPPKPMLAGLRGRPRGLRPSGAASVSAQRTACIEPYFRARSTAALRERPTVVTNARVTEPFGLSSTCAIKLMTGSSTAPTRPRSVPPVVTSAPGASGLPPRPKNAPRSVSYPANVTAVPSRTRRCTRMAGSSSADCRRRANKRPSNSATCSLTTNMLENAGCVDACFASRSTGLPALVTVRRRERVVSLWSVICRTSTSSAAATASST